MSLCPPPRKTVTPLMKLRPYQTAAEDAAFNAWQEGNRSVLEVLPTGCGKSVIFASVIKRFKQRTMVLVHRQELAWQARDKIQKVTGLRVEVEMGSYRASMNGDLFNPNCDVIVSTVQTQTAGGDGSGRMLKFDPGHFGLLICDEAHHFVSQSFRRNIEHYLQNPKLKVFGCTATPDRADEEALGQVFDSVAYDYELLDAIKDGWLVPIEQQMVSVDGLDFSQMRTTAGDLNGADLAQVMEQEKNLHGVASATIDIGRNKRGLGFASSVNHARIMADIFNRHKSGMAAWICGKTEELERRQIISDFAKGKIQWLWNCGVFLEGFDDSGIEMISIGRPTKSRALYSQIVGRGTRPHESIAHKLNDVPNAARRRFMIQTSCKPNVLILDFVGNSGRHKLMTTADILGGNVSEEAIEAAIKQARGSGNQLRMDKILEEEEKRIEERKKRELEQSARKARLVGKATYKMQKIDPFDLLQIKPVQPRGWDNKKTLTEKQANILRKAGYDPNEMEYGRAKQLIGILIDRWNNHKCSLAQVNILKKFGCDTEMSFEDAGKMITAIKANGWRKPEKAVTGNPATEIDDDEVPF
jgi:superfamily II DNA or RNA helicase